MFRKSFVLFVFLAMAANNTVFSQAVAIDTALANAAKEILESVPKGTKIAVLNISSDYAKLSDYIIDELIANLVNTRSFQVVPRSTVELELAKGELDFQYTGDVSDESQKSLGKFLGAGTIISGAVTRDAANSYRLVVNAIDLESFTYQSSYRISVMNDSQVKALIAGSGGVFYEDYTTGERLGMGGLNIFGGIGSIINGHKIGWVTTGIEVAGILTLLASLLGNEPDPYNLIYNGLNGGVGEDVNNTDYQRDKKNYESTKNGLIITGATIIGAGVVFGFVIPFFHHKPNNTSVSQNYFPFNLELVSSNNQEIKGFRLSYNLKF
jgi:TolB-like protein